MGGFLESLFGSSKLKELEAERDKLQHKVAELTTAMDSTRMHYGRVGIQTRCAVLLMEMNNAAFSIDPDARERVRCFTMIVSRAIAILQTTGRDNIIVKLADEYLPSIIDAIQYLSPRTKPMFLDSINSIENMLFQYMTDYVEYKQIDAAATLKAIGTSISMNNTGIIQYIKK